MATQEPQDDAAEITTLGIRIPDELRAKIREAAKLEERTESSFARFYLGKAAEAVLSATAETTNTGANQ